MGKRVYVSGKQKHCFPLIFCSLDPAGRVRLDFGKLFLDSTIREAESGRDTDGWSQLVVASPRERGGTDVFLEVNSTQS